MSGRSVSAAGDVGGDGFNDLTVGAWRHYYNRYAFPGVSFVICGATGDNRVEVLGQDLLDVSAIGFASIAALVAAASATGPGGHDTLIQLNGDDTILLENYNIADLDAGDVIL